MRKSVKRFFLLGLAVGIAGYAATHVKKVRHAVRELVDKKKLSREDGEKLKVEIMAELDKLEPKLKKMVRKVRPKVKKAVRKAKPKLRKAVKKARKAAKK